VFDGVRAEESDSRAQYGDVSIGTKNINQINARPIYEWGTGEVYLYLLKNNILFNKGYKQGFFRIGCKVCPMSSNWWDSIANDIYNEELSNLLSRVESYASFSKTSNEQKKYIEEGGWKARVGGRYFVKGENRITEMVENDTLVFEFSSIKQNWLDVSPLLGTIVAKRKNKYIHKIDKQEFTLIIENRGKRIKYASCSKMDRFIISHLRGVANKAAYCIGCKACMVQCPKNAFIINGNNQIFIREDKCIHCLNCLNFVRRKGCIVADCLIITGGRMMDSQKIEQYKHFGFRKPWLKHFFDYGMDCFTKNELGSVQYYALKLWVRHAGLIEPIEKGGKTEKTTELYEKIKKLGESNASTWAIIWANLAYGSNLVKWYMLSVVPGEAYEKNDLIFMLGDDYAQSTRDNAVTALLETFRYSPIGSDLKQGIPDKRGGTWRYAKGGWETPEAAAILYSLYLYAEKTGRYTFSLKQLEEAKTSPEALGVDPVSVFGLKSGAIKGILQEIALHNKEYLRVSFVKDLDTVHLTQNVASIDIISLFQ
jgi:phosphoadenosine phosphosulfate reductase